MNKEQPTLTFEQTAERESTHERSLRAAQISLDLGSVAMNFARIDRAPRYADGERVMREDYGVSSLEALQQCQADLHQRIIAKFGNEFPELDLAHKLLCELFEFRFEQQAELLT